MVMLSIPKKYVEEQNPLISDVVVKVYMGDRKGDIRFSDYFRESDFPVLIPNKEGVSEVGLLKPLQIVLYNTGNKIYRKPTISITSDVPFYVSPFVHGQEHTLLELSNRTTCMSGSYKGCLRKFKFLTDLVPSGRMYFNIFYAKRLKEDAPKYEFNFEYVDRFGNNNLTIIEEPDFTGQTKTIEIYMEDQLLHKIMVNFRR